MDISEKSCTKESPISPLVSDVLKLKVWTANCLAREGIQTLDELTDRTSEELLQIRRFGDKCLHEIREELDRVGRRLKGE